MDAFARKGDLWLPKEDGVRRYREMPRPGYGKILPFRALNAVTFDSKFEKGLAGQASGFNFASNAGDVTGTVSANSNRILIGFVGFRGITSSAVQMTWDSVNMGSQNGIVHLANTGSNQDLYLFGLINPNTGNKTLACTWTGGSASICMGAISIYNADQTTGWQNSGNTNSSGLSATANITSANGNMAIAGHQNENASSTTLSAGDGGWTETDLSGNYGMAYRASSGASTTITWTLGTSVTWGMVYLDVIAASSSSGGGPLIRGGELMKGALVRGGRVVPS